MIATARVWLTRHAVVVIAAIFAIVGVLIVMPAIGGYIVLPDFANGPQHQFPITFWGIARSGRTDGVLFSLIMWGARTILGGKLAGAVAIGAFFPIAAAGIARLVGGSLLRRFTAACVFCINPFVFDRISAGQVAFLWAMALLGFAVYAWQQRRLRPWWWLHAGLWLAVITSLSIHFAFIGIIAMVCVAFVLPGKRIIDLLMAWLVAGILSAYIVVPAMVGLVRDTVTGADVATYASTTRWGSIWLALVSGTGFWRTSQPDAGGASILVVLSLTLLAGLGIAGILAMWQPQRRLALSVAAMSVFGLFAAAGTHGPTGWLWRFAFDYIPGFGVMRETQKFLVLYVLGAAWAISWGVGQLGDVVRSSNAMSHVLRRMLVAAGIAVVTIMMSPSLFTGAGGALNKVSYPQSWYHAQTVMGDGNGRILAFPWHQYNDYSFIHGAAAGVPANFFTRRVITSQNPEVGSLRRETGVGNYVAQLIARGGSINRFGALIAPLGVRYVAVTRNGDMASYRWLYHQNDMTVVYQSKDIVVFANHAHGIGRRAELIAVKNIDDLIDVANHGALNGRAAMFDRSAGTPQALGREQARTPRPAIWQSSPIEYQIGSGEGKIVAIPEAYDRAWGSSGHAGLKSASSTLLFPASTTTMVVRYRDFDWILAGYSASIFGVLFVVVVLIGRRYIQTK